MDTRWRIAFFIRALNGGGAQRVTVNLANGLATKGHLVDVVLARREGTLLSQVSSEVNIVNLQTPTIPVVGTGASFPALVRYLRSTSPAVLFSAMTYVNVVAIPAVKLAGGMTSVVPTEHTTFGMQDLPKERLVDGLASVLYPFSDRVVAVSDGVADSVANQTRVDSNDVSVIHNPVVTPSIDEKASIEPDHPWIKDRLEVILNAGRLEPEKDHKTLLRAFAQLAEDRPQSRLIILGEGSLLTELNQIASNLDLEDRISFPGFVANPYGYMNNADVYALSSRREGLPSALIEAMACGCPVVATDCPSGPREILCDGRFGPLVPVGDEYALAEALTSVLDDPPDPEIMRNRANTFSRDTVLEQYEALIEEVVNRKGSTQPNCP